jgi:hypothetical protein
MGAYPSCAAAGFEALRAQGDVRNAWSALLGLQSVYLEAGRDEEARRLIGTAAAFEKQQKYLFVAGTLAGAPFGEEAEASVRSLEEEEGEWGATQIWSVGVWHGHQGRSAQMARSISAAAARASREGATPSDSLLVDVLNAWMTLSRGDTLAAIDRFEALAPVAEPRELAWGIWESLGAERSTLARLLIDRGEYRQGLQVAEYLDHPQPVIYMAYLPVSLRLRARAADALGDTGAAGTYRTRLGQLQNAAIGGALTSSPGGN